MPTMGLESCRPDSAGDPSAGAPPCGVTVPAGGGGPVATGRIGGHHLAPAVAAGAGCGRGAGAGTGGRRQISMARPRPSAGTNTKSATARAAASESDRLGRDWRIVFPPEPAGVSGREATSSALIADSAARRTQRVP